MLIRDEGLRLRAYKDTKGFWTIGVGRNLSARKVSAPELFWYRTAGISRQKAMEWLDEDFATARKDCIIIFGSELFESWSLNRQLGWANMAFNLGLHRLLGFRNTIAAAKAGNWARVEAGLRGSLWATQVKSRADRVIGLICREEWLYA